LSFSYEKFGKLTFSCDNTTGFVFVFLAQLQIWISEIKKPEQV